MTDVRETDLDIGHPAPDRDRVGGGALLFGLVGAALAWTVQIAAGSSFAGLYCVTGDGRGTPPSIPDWAEYAAMAINLAALLAALAALAIAWRNLTRSHRHEVGPVADMVDAGEGRTRFMSLWGVFASVLFILAIAFNTISIFWIGLCQS